MLGELERYKVMAVSLWKTLMMDGEAPESPGLKLATRAPVGTGHLSLHSLCQTYLPARGRE